MKNNVQDELRKKILTTDVNLKSYRALDYFSSSTLPDSSFFIFLCFVAAKSEPSRDASGRDGAN